MVVCCVCVDDGIPSWKVTSHGSRVNAIFFRICESSVGSRTHTK